MSTVFIRQAFFTGGQIDKKNWKRTDINDYNTCAQLLLNCEIGTTGLVKKRKGTKFLLNVNGAAVPTSQLYEFIDAFGTIYIMVSSNLNFFIYTIINGVITPYQTLSTPYLAADLPNLDYALTNDSLVLTHQNYAPARIYLLPDGVTFIFHAIPIYPISPIDFGVINYSAYTVSASVTAGTLTFQITGTPGFTTDWIGGLIVGLGSSVTSPLGSALITNVVFSGGTTTFTGIVTNPFVPNGSFPTIGSAYLIQQPAWSQALGYPGKCAFYQNRLWLANAPSLPGTLFGSKINQPANFDVGVGLDTDAIIYTLGQSDAGGIQWINGGKQLEIYTSNFEFAAPQEQNIGLTPATFSVRLQSSYGSTTNMKPITYLNDSYFVTRSDNALMDFHFDGIGQTYTSSNISALAESLINAPINRALLRGSSSTQDNFIYLVNQDYTITTFQFAYATKLAALTQTQFQLDVNGTPTVQILDITSVNNKIYFLKYYPLQALFSLDTFDDAIWLDGWTPYQTGTTTLLVMGTDGVITGLSQFNGQTVNIVYNNQDFGSALVSGGQCTCLFPQSAPVNVIVGYMYPWEVDTMYLFAGANESNYYKQITRIFVDYYNTLGLYVNGTLVNFQDFSPTISPQTDTAVIDSFDGWNRFANIKLTQNVPFDCQVTAIGYQIDATIV